MWRPRSPRKPTFPEKRKVFSGYFAEAVSKTDVYEEYRDDVWQFVRDAIGA